ncbi:unnamed protein product [Amoebophrya sp. A25]|nr:unnamed protein product [Amoebophrya sp. A25]|eukprot:GSA25T00000914001.1
MLESLASNPMVEVAAGMSTLPYAWEITTFLFLAQVVDDLGGATTGPIGTRVIDCLKVLVRAFGGVHVILPLILGTFPSVLLKDLDRYAALYAAVVVIFVLLGKFIPEKLARALKTPKRIAYCMFFCNACTSGVIQGVVAYPDSKTAPLLLGFLAVMGGYLLEQGLGTKLFDREYSNDQLLAVFGPAIFSLSMGMLMQHPYTMPEGIARALVLLFRLSCEVVDYNEILSFINLVRIRCLRKIAKTIGANP